MRDSLVEGIVVADDDLMARYLEGEEISADELAKTLARGVVSSQVFPVICGSATKLVGIDRLLDMHLRRGPLPPRAPARPGCAPPGPTATEVVEVACDPAGQPLAWVFKTIADPYVGKISLFKVLPRARCAQTPSCSTRGPRPRSASTLSSRLRGKEQIPLTEVAAGDIGAVAKLAATNTGDTLTPRNMPVSRWCPPGSARRRR